MIESEYCDDHRAAIFRTESLGKTQSLQNLLPIMSSTFGPKGMGKQSRALLTETGKDKVMLTNPFVRVRRAGHKLQHLCSLLSQTPAVEDLSVALLKVIKLLGIGRVQEPG